MILFGTNSSMRCATQSLAGKRVRGFLVLESSRLHSVPANQAVRAATAVECLHAYSLIHDDLPCMDNDDLRRGRPTVHKRWNESLAVLAGDALQSLAYHIISEPRYLAARRSASGTGSFPCYGGPERRGWR